MLMTNTENGTRSIQATALDQVKFLQNNKITAGNPSGSGILGSLYGVIFMLYFNIYLYTSQEPVRNNSKQFPVASFIPLDLSCVNITNIIHTKNILKKHIKILITNSEYWDFFHKMKFPSQLWYILHIT